MEFKIMLPYLVIDYLFVHVVNRVISFNTNFTRNKISPQPRYPLTFVPVKKKKPLKKITLKFREH